MYQRFGQRTANATTASSRNGQAAASQPVQAALASLLRAGANGRSEVTGGLATVREAVMAASVREVTGNREQVIGGRSLTPVPCHLFPSSGGASRLAAIQPLCP